MSLSQTSAQRVRFRNYLPKRMIEKVDEDYGPAPVFSPSVRAASTAARNGNSDLHPSSSLLHSIFSPPHLPKRRSDEQGSTDSSITTAESNRGSASNRKNDFVENSISYYDKENTAPAKTPVGKKKTSFSLPHQPGPSSSAVSLLQSPLAPIPSDEREDEDDESVYMTPAQNPRIHRNVVSSGGDGSNLSRTPFSALSFGSIDAGGIAPMLTSHPSSQLLFPSYEASNHILGPSSSKLTMSKRDAILSSPYKSLPRTDMARLDNIEACTDVAVLRNIVDVLSEQERDFPFLLNRARERLEQQLTQDKASVKREAEGTTTCNSKGRSVGVPFVHFQINQHDSLSLSTDAEDNVRADSDEPPYRSSPTSSSPAMVKSMYAIPSTVRAADTPRYTPSVRQEEVASELQRLTKRLEDLQVERNDERRQYVEKLKSIRDAKLESDEKLRDVLAESGEATRELQEAVSLLEQQKQQLSRRLMEEQQISQLQRQQALESEERLSLKIQQLSDELSQSHLAEQNNRDLSVFLQSAQRNLRTVQEERDAMLRGILNATEQQDVDVSTVRCCKKVSASHRSLSGSSILLLLRTQKYLSWHLR